ERVVARRGQLHRRIRLAVVARRRDDDETVQPELLDRLVERIEQDAALGRAREGHVDDLDPVLVLVRQDPVEAREDVARQGHALAVCDADVDEVRGRGRTDVTGSAARREPGDHRAVTLGIADSRRGGHEIAAGDDASTEVRRLRGVDTAVYDRDRRRRRGQEGRAGDAGRVELQTGQRTDG